MNCHECKYVGEVIGSCHRSCLHPKFSGAAGVLALIHIHTGNSKYLPVLLDKRVISQGWVNWPLDFDPCWIKGCNLFERKEVNDTNEQAEPERTESCGKSCNQSRS